MSVGMYQMLASSLFTGVMLALDFSERGVISCMRPGCEVEP